MTIGLPKALLYYRYGSMWTTFFEALGCAVVVSRDTDQRIADRGIACSEGECCLPVKVFMGHVASLLGQCDRILVPRFERLDRDEEFCVRFWGLPDIVAGTFRDAPLISYNLNCRRPGDELRQFLKMGKELGKSRKETRSAYQYAKAAQLRENSQRVAGQTKELDRPGLKVLLAAQPYIVHDGWMGGQLVDILREQGAVPVYGDRCDPARCRACSKEVSRDLYWTMNKEIVGAIPLLKDQVDGAILITAFPCGTDCLVNELTLHRVRDIPLAHIVLDEHQSRAGLQTRMECFVDILRARRGFHAS